jgi:hypothetical protein
MGGNPQTAIAGQPPPPPPGFSLDPSGFNYAKPGPYTTALAPDDEQRFQQWVKSNKVPWQDSPKADYDMRGYWKAQQGGDADAHTEVNPVDHKPHYPDTWKTPYHKSFSNESMYATPDAPHWEGQNLVPTKSSSGPPPPPPGFTLDGMAEAQPLQAQPLAAPSGPTSIGPATPSLWDRVKSVFTEGNPNYSSRTVNDPKFGQTQLVTPEAAMTPAGQQRHPIATGLGEVAGGMTSPQNVAMIAASGGMGSLPGAARAIIPRLVSAGFTAQMVKGAYDQYPQLKEALDRGDASEAERVFTHLVATGAMAALSGQHAAKGEAPANISPQTAKPFTRPVAAAIEKTGEAASKAVQTVREIGEPEPHETMIRALKPPKRAGDAADKINLAGQDVQAVAQTLRKPVKTIDDVLEMSHEAKKAVWKEYEDQFGGNKKATFDGNKIADAMVSSVDARSRTQNPELVSKVEKIADTYRKPMDLETAEDFLQSANNELDSFYKLNKVGRDAARKSPTMGYKVAEAEALRDGLYDTLDKLTGGNAREIKQRYGALSDLQRWALERKPVYERQQPVGLIEGAGRLAGMGQIALGVGTAHLGRVAAGLATAAEAKMLRDANDTNKLIEKAFNGPKAFKARDAAAPPTPPAAVPERVLKTGPGGKPPAVPFANRTEFTGTAEGPTELGPRGGKGVFAPKRLPAPKEASTTPPAVPFQHRLEATRTVEDASKLGTRGEGGARTTVKGLLPAPARESTTPPAVPFRYRSEATGTATDATRLGPRGRGGAVVPERKLLSLPSAKEAREQFIRPPSPPRGAGGGEPPEVMHAAELAEIREETGRPHLSIADAQRYRIAKLARTAAETKTSNELGGMKRAGD